MAANSFSFLVYFSAAAARTVVLNVRDLRTAARRRSPFSMHHVTSMRNHYIIRVLRFSQFWQQRFPHREFCVWRRPVYGFCTKPFCTRRSKFGDKVGFSAIFINCWVVCETSYHNGHFKNKAGIYPKHWTHCVKGIRNIFCKMIVDLESGDKSLYAMESAYISKFLKIEAPYSYTIHHLLEESPRRELSSKRELFWMKKPWWSSHAVDNWATSRCSLERIISKSSASTKKRHLYYIIVE